METDGRNQKRKTFSGSSAPPAHPQPAHTFLIRRGDYHNLLSYQKAEVVFDITYRFCQRFLSSKDCTVDQMVQAARSGKQNIGEGSKASATSTEMEIRLTNVARASLGELLDDYCDFLRVRELRTWDKDGREAHYVRTLGQATPLTFEVFRKFVETRSAEVVANIAICLIHQANYLLDRQVNALEQNFITNGGLRERMINARLQAREEQRHKQRPER